MSVHQQLDGVCGKLAQRCRGILARTLTTNAAANAGEVEASRRWKPRLGQTVLVVTVCDAAAHCGLEDDVIGCRGWVSAIERETDHPYEVLVSLSERVFLYGRFAVGELAPLGQAAARSAECHDQDRSVPPGCRPVVALVSADGPLVR